MLREPFTMFLTRRESKRGARHASELRASNAGVKWKLTRRGLMSDRSAGRRARVVELRPQIWIENLIRLGFTHALIDCSVNRTDAEATAYLFPRAGEPRPERRQSLIR